jgi:hypothetical protein
MTRNLFLQWLGRTRGKIHLMKKTCTLLPQFETEVEERSFWETHDSTEYVD